MNTHVAAYVGGATPLKCLLLLIVVSLLVAPSLALENMTVAFDTSDAAHYNVSSRLSNDASTPFIVWFAAIALAVLLILLSLMGSKLFPNGEEGLVSIMAWFPAGFALYTSFAVDWLNGVGVTGGAEAPVGNGGAYATNEWVLMESHTVYHFDVAAIGIFILLLFAIGNTYRIWATQKKLAALSETESKENYVNDS